MRVYTTLLLIVVSVVACSAATTTFGRVNHAELTPQSFNTLRAEGNGARYLRKRNEDESVDFNNEERWMVTTLIERGKSLFDKTKKYEKIFKKADNLTTKKKEPEYFTKLANRLEKEGKLPKDKIEQFKDIGKRFSDNFYQKGNLDPVTFKRT
ncbi:Avirulence (Avh) protein [Phytophthora megakarya]|uniref:RxLR effector protein n=1 Tax=Phytophthora megakarya TaxID=4795 RepID=A0A225WYD2_9STRA|nr:Avirulence (Avh) protein [Phytophthora megakarya]